MAKSKHTIRYLVPAVIFTAGRSMVAGIRQNRRAAPADTPMVICWRSAQRLVQLFCARVDGHRYCLHL